MRTRGIDFSNEHTRTVGELKTGPSIPQIAQWQAIKELHWEQLATYSHAITQRFGWTPEHWVIVSAETVRPYCATALEMPALGIHDAFQRVLSWCATLRRCLDTGRWPGPDEGKTVTVDPKIQLDVSGLDVTGPDGETGEITEGDAAQ